MRVYELAKEAGVTSADVLRAAESCGAEVTSAISSIDAGDLASLKEAVAGLSKSADVESVRAAKRAKAGEMRKKVVDSDRDRLSAHLATAKAAAEGKIVRLAPLAPAEPVEVKEEVAKEEPKAKIVESPKPAEPVKVAPVKTEAPKVEKPKAPKTEKKIEKTEKKVEKKIEKAEKKVEKKTSEPKVYAPAEAGSVEEKIEVFIKGLLEKMGSDAVPHAWKENDNTFKVELTGSDLGYLIGRRGDTLDAIQHLANYTINRGVEGHIRINVDAEDYRQKREDSLRRYARKKAQQVLKARRRTTLEPMNAYERHVIHAALQDMENITTHSTGVEPNRRVVIEYVR